MIPLLIECHTGQLVPYSFICQHLMDNPQQVWVGMDVNDGREVEKDWICEECLNNFESGDTLEEVISPICIDCVKILKSEEVI